MSGGQPRRCLQGEVRGTQLQWVFVCGEGVHRGHEEDEAHICDEGQSTGGAGGRQQDRRSVPSP